MVENNSKENFRNMFHILIYVSGMVLLTLQISGVLKTFMAGQTNYSLSRNIRQSLALPTIILCPKIPNLKIETPLTNPMAQNKTAFFEQFYLLGQQFNLTAVKNHVGEIGNKLFVGTNFDSDGNNMFEIEELMTPGLGQCYAITANHENVKFSNGDTLYIETKFQSKIQSLYLYFTSHENKHGMVFHDHGKQELKKYTVKTGQMAGFSLRKLNFLRMESTQTCRDYTKSGDTFMDCMIESQIDCYMNESNSNCRCIPAQSKTQFEIMNISLKYCQTNEEFGCARKRMHDCYFNKATSDKCPKPCKDYRYNAIQMEGEIDEEIKEKNIINFVVAYRSVDEKVYQEYYIYDTFSFIGNVGGSLGLFIGFSYTDFLGNILDFVFKKW